jgi:Nuclease-related domain
VEREYWFLVGAIVVVALLVAGLAGLWWRRRQSDLKRALRGVTVEGLQDVLVPNGMGGHIHIEHLILTARGVLVVDVKRFEGVIFASDRMNEWTVIGEQGRFTFPNPQPTLYDRIAAVRQLVRDVEVAGFVLFPGAADFSKGRPKDVMLPAELVERYKKPERSDLERLTLAYAPHWERIREAAVPAPTRSARY